MVNREWYNWPEAVIVGFPANKGCLHFDRLSATLIT